MEKISYLDKRGLDTDAGQRFARRYPGKGGIPPNAPRTKMWKLEASSRATRRPAEAELLTNAQLEAIICPLARTDQSLGRLAHYAREQSRQWSQGGISERQLEGLRRVFGVRNPRAAKTLKTLQDLAVTGELRGIFAGGKGSPSYDRAVSTKIESASGMRFKRGELVMTATRREGKVEDISPERRMYLVDYGDSQGWVRESDLQRPAGKKSADKFGIASIRAAIRPLGQRPIMPTARTNKAVEDQVRRLLSQFSFPSYPRLQFAGLRDVEYDPSGSIRRAVANFMVGCGTPIGHFLQIEVAVPITGDGQAYMPSQFKMGSQVYPLTQEALNGLFRSMVVDRPVAVNIMTPRSQVVARPQFKDHMFGRTM